MRNILGVSIALPIVILGLSCRTQWRHPEATAGKYADDTFFCQYGIERSEWEAQQREKDTSQIESDRASALSTASRPVGGARPNGKECMVKLGWKPVVEAWDAARWGVTPDLDSWE